MLNSRREILVADKPQQKVRNWDEWVSVSLTSHVTVKILPSDGILAIFAAAVLVIMR